VWCGSNKIWYAFREAVGNRKIVGFSLKTETSGVVIGRWDGVYLYGEPAGQFTSKNFITSLGLYMATRSKEC